MVKSKMAEFKMVEFKMAAIIKLSENEWLKFSQSNMIEFKMAAIIKFSQNEWVKVFFMQKVGTNLGKCVSLRGKIKMAESKMVEFNMAEFKMAAIIKLSEKQYIWVRLY